MTDTTMKKLGVMNSDELMDFWAVYHHCGNKAARKMFPHRSKGHRILCKDLANYAANLATYYTCGDDMYWTIACKIVEGLPVDAKLYI